jgi:nucleoside-diphosphate-sugar epimerase
LNKHISIIGCGWLGFPLAKELISKKYKVKGSTTNKEKLPFLKSFGIDSFYIELTQETIKGDILKCLSESEILILNIPPGIRKNPENDFVNQISRLILNIEKSTIRNVLFIGSTSVYKDEEMIPVITEETIANPDTESGRQLLEVEKLLQNNPHFNTTILRFSGLFGAERHPATYLSGKTDLRNPEAPVNLIHLNDCIGIILNIIQKNSWNEIFNASTSPHPSRKDYYTSICKAMEIPMPEFRERSINRGKYIESAKLIQLLSYEFKVKLNN